MDWWNGVLSYQDPSHVFQDECVASYVSGLNECLLLPSRIDFVNRMDTVPLFSYLSQLQSSQSRKTMVFSIRPAHYGPQYESLCFFYSFCRYTSLVRYLSQIKRAGAHKLQSDRGLEQEFYLVSSENANLPPFFNLRKNSLPYLIGVIVVDNAIVCHLILPELILISRLTVCATLDYL